MVDSPIINNQITQATKGGTQKFVSLGALRGLKATFPPLPEQRRIAAILDQADALRAKRREALAQLDKLTQSILLRCLATLCRIRRELKQQPYLNFVLVLQMELTNRQNGAIQDTRFISYLAK